MIGRIIRILFGAMVAAPVLVVVGSSEAPLLYRVAALATLLVSAWRPAVGLVVLAASSPAGLLIGPIPARAAEGLAWAFLAGLLLGIHRPLMHRGSRNSLILPVLAFLACAFGSWMTLTVRVASTQDIERVAVAVGQSLLRDHLLYGSAEPETWTLLLIAATISLALAAASIVRDSPRVALHIGAALTISMTTMSVLSAASATYLWAANEHAAWFLQRRSAFHLGDLNAAGSQYVLAGLTALGLAMFDQRRRTLWSAILVLMLPGAWFAGSRSAALAGVVAGLLVIQQGLERHWRPTRAQVTAIATTAVIVLLAGGAILARGRSDNDAAGVALRMRMQFAETSVRMTASAPVYGVGIGRYHGRSHEFMPAELSAVYPYENAHNFFAQQFAELGFLGGIAFLWLICTALKAGRATLSAGDKLAIGLFAGVAGYLVTCLAGHPLLVPEAAMPFGVALGAAAGAGIGAVSSRTRWRAGAAAAVVALIASAPVAAAFASSDITPTIERGFWDAEREPDGTLFRWTMRHAVTYIRAEGGYLRLVAYAPDGDIQPYRLEVRVEGTLLDTLVLDQDNWQTFLLPIRPRVRSEAAKRRIDLRVDRIRTRTLGSGMIEELGIKVRQLEWIKPDDR